MPHITGIGIKKGMQLKKQKGLGFRLVVVQCTAHFLCCEWLPKADILEGVQLVVI